MYDDIVEQARIKGKTLQRTTTYPKSSKPPTPHVQPQQHHHQQQQQSIFPFPPPLQPAPVRSHVRDI